MAVDAFKQSLVALTDPQPWDQTIFLSSQTINNAFKNMFDLAKAIDPKFSPVCYIEMRTRSGQIQATLKPSTVVLNVENPKENMFIFNWNIESGTMSLYRSDDEDNYTTMDFNISGWRVAFRSTMAEKPLPIGSDRYNAIKERMGNPIGDFSLASLFIDIQGEAGLYVEGSDFCGTDWAKIAKENPVVSDNFANLCGAWARRMQNGWHTTVASRLCTSKPETVNPNVPTFPPTLVCHDLYAWRDTPSSRNSNTSTANALCHLIMTQNKQPPQDKSIPYTGTWVTTNPGLPGRDALMCISYNQFWESWLLPKFQRINLALQVQPQDSIFESDGGTGCRYILDFSSGYCTEHPSGEDKYWQFTWHPDDKAWKWSANKDTCTLHTQRQIDSHGTKWTLDQGASAETTLSFVPSAEDYQATIKLTGTVQIHSYMNATVALTSWGTAWMTSDMNFELSYTATRVDNGGLQIQEQKRYISEPSTSTKGPTGVVTCDPPWSTVAADVMAGVQWGLNDCITSFADHLLTDLNNQHKFVLPGAGDFLCSRVMFNQHGDLLVNLAFNGAAPPNTKQQVPALLKSAPKTQQPHTKVPGFVAKYRAAPSPTPRL